MRRRLSALTIGMALTSALIFVGAGSASAHTPAVSASCSGVQLSGTNYDASKANQWSATVNGVTTTGTFGASLSKTIPVPQDGASSTWSATVQAADGSYKSTNSGTVGPCGKPPVPQQPASKVEVKQDVSTPNCDTLLVTTTSYSRTTPYVYVEGSNSWVLGTPGAWQATGTTTRHVTQQECAAPPKPVLAEQRDVVNPPDCAAFTVTTDHQAREAVYTFNEASWAWAQNGWTDWHTTSSTNADATLEQCPPPAKPDPIVSSTDQQKQKCGDDFATVTTTTTTIDYVLDSATRTWSLGEPVVTTSTSKVTADKVDCVTPVKQTANHVDQDAVLPDTGGPSSIYALAAGLLLLCGTLILTFQRRTAPGSDRMRS